MNKELLRQTRSCVDASSLFLTDVNILLSDFKVTMLNIPRLLM